MNLDEAKAFLDENKICIEINNVSNLWELTFGCGNILLSSEFIECIEKPRLVRIIKQLYEENRRTVIKEYLYTGRERVTNYMIKTDVLIGKEPGVLVIVTPEKYQELIFAPVIDWRELIERR